MQVNKDTYRFIRFVKEDNTSLTYCILLLRED